MHARTHTHISWCFTSSQPVWLKIRAKQMRVHFNFFYSFLQKSQSIFISFPFHVVLSENSLNTASRKMVNAHTVSLCRGDTGLTLNCLRIQYQDDTKCNTDTNTMAARSHKTYLHMCYQNPRTEHIPDWKTNELQNMSNFFLFYDHTFFPLYFCMLKI